MCKDKRISVPKKAVGLDTLALLAKTPDLGTSLSRDRLIKRQIAKAHSVPISLALVDEDSPLKGSYWNTYHCASELVYSNGKLTSKFCGNRWCTVCARIRMAKMIKNYSVPIMQLPDLHFVTLTSKNVHPKKGDDHLGLLKAEYHKFSEAWSYIRKRFTYLKKIGLLQDFAGMRKIEYTVKPSTGYNLHYHILVSGEQSGRLLIDYWLRQHPAANRLGQDIRKADKGSIVELFKYVSKGIHQGKMYAREADYMHQVMYNKNTFYPFGGLKKFTDESIEGIETQEVDFLNGGDPKSYEWNKKQREWLDNDGMSLTDFIISGPVSDYLDKLQKSTDSIDIGEQPKYDPTVKVRGKPSDIF